jgi:hypothetical protein
LKKEKNEKGRIELKPLLLVHQLSLQQKNSLEKPSKKVTLLGKKRRGGGAKNTHGCKIENLG